MHTAVFSLLALLAAPAAGSSQPRPLKVDDLFALKDVADPRLSPDGKWVAYTVTSLDAKTDTADTDVYMAPIAGGEPVRLTSSKKTEDHPRFSPDGKWLAFLSDREGKKTQVFLLSRAGGEAVKLTDFGGAVSDLVWAPDGQRLALVVSDPDPDEPAEAKTGGGEGEEPAKKPLVIVRRQFKRDGEGYLREIRKHLYLFDLVGKKSLQLTSGPFDDREPAWSPDGQRLAFVSNRSLPDPDANQDSEIFLVDAREGAIPRAVSRSAGTDTAPAFSPDGQWIAYVAGGDPKDMWYGASHLAVVSPDGKSRPLTAALDRNVLSPRFSPDGRFVYFLLEEGGNQPLARVPVGGGPVERAVAGQRDVQAFDLGPQGEVVVLETSPQQPAEVSRLGADGALERVTRVNDEFLKGIHLGEVRRFKAKGADGTEVDGFLTLPPDYQPGEKRPAILRIHGGPTMQYSTAFEFQWQALAAGGYAVIASNPRGSTGYGTAFSRAIWADWGNKDFEDLMAAVDHVIGLGVADPERLGVGGWSYGGMLTDYVITKTSRFKVAISGASEANYLANYGTDHYQYEWETELGLPWKATDLWLRLSPWFQLEKVTTPTLILCGDADQNVPLLNSEQLYQALRRLGKVDTELVIYPGETHEIERPSHQKDRLDRYLAWYGRYLKPAASTLGSQQAEATSLLGRPLISPEIPEALKKPLEENLAAATADFVKDPHSVDATVWLARRTAYLGRYREAIAVLTRGLAEHPNDPRLLRHRGHRYITVRELDKAVADLERAARLVKGKPDQIEPDGAPNSRNQPVGTLQFNIWYHLGLAHYLKGDFAKALPAYRECWRLSAGHPDRLVAAGDWLYLTLRRLGQKQEADRVLADCKPGLSVIENHAYLNRLLLYQGVYTPEELLRAGGGPVGEPTYGYAVGIFQLLNGDQERAVEQFRRVARSPQWAAFGVIAAEAELARPR